MVNCVRIVVLLLLIVAGTFTSVAQRLIVPGVSLSGNYTFVDNSRVHADSLLIEGRVVESLAKRDLMNAFMIPIDADGNPGDTIKVERKVSFVNFNRHREISNVRFMTVRKDSTYVFEIGCPGYTSQTIVYKVERLGKREFKRELPMIVLERAPHKLGEVQVVASKVKFYHRGDTLVYNADAFQLAEGSMLDELIRQLPGVELSKDGEIKVNGERVETLLLNGKYFFSGDNELMLENLGAYTVKDVEVYRGQTAVERWVDDPNAKKHLTMDVKLKKEYSIGYMLNAQGGYGTEDRYLGRLFASRFSPTANVTLVGNINNVNDYFAPHSVYDSWQSTSMTRGDSRRKTVGLNYDVESDDWKRTMHGSFRYSGDRNVNINNGNSATYYSANQVYAYNYSRSLNRGMKLNTSHDAMFDLGRVNISAQLSGAYGSSDQVSSSLSASFNEEQADMTQEALETIYGDGSTSTLASLINRSRTLGNSNLKAGNGSLTTTARYKVPGTSDVLTLSLSGDYNTSKSENWNDYMIDYGDESVVPEHRRQYTDRSPDHNMSLTGLLTYTARIGKVSLDFGYKYSYSDSKTDSYMYELQNLADMGEYGTLPPDYLSAFDPADSYMSKQRVGTHSFSPRLRYEMKRDSGAKLSLDISPDIALVNRRLDYWRDNHLYNIRHKSSLREAVSGSIGISLYSSSFFAETGTRNSFTYRYDVHTQLPDMLSLVDIVDDSDPLFIREGNPGLKSSYSHSHSFSWSIGRKLSNMVDVNYSYTTNSMIQASTYDMKTGVTRTRAENINGNNRISVSDRVFYWFGSSGQFSLRTYTSGERMHNVDMIGTNGAEPTRTSADTWSIKQDVNFDWRFGKGHSLNMSCSALNRRTYSDRAGFNKINAFHINYGLTGLVRLPAGFELGTSFSLYTRRGYGSKELDTTDAIWNAQASYTPKGKRWVFMINAYDLLHQISNVYYNVTATGRSVTYTNSLPRYVLATVQYRLNIQPKKRSNDI